MDIPGVLIDTNAYAAFKRGRLGAVDVIRHVPLIGVSSIVLGELLSGFSLGTRSQANQQDLDAFLHSSRVRLYPIDAETSSYYAAVYRNLRHIGRPVPTNDLWIAATALQHGLAVFTYDRHFAVIPGIVTCEQITDLIDQ